MLRGWTALCLLVVEFPLIQNYYIQSLLAYLERKLIQNSTQNGMNGRHCSMQQCCPNIRNRMNLLKSKFKEETTPIQANSTYFLPALNSAWRQHSAEFRFHTMLDQIHQNHQNQYEVSAFSILKYHLHKSAKRLFTHLVLAVREFFCCWRDESPFVLQLSCP